LDEGEIRGRDPERNGREVLARLSAQGQPIVLLIDLDQTQASERHQAVMVAVRLGGRALPLA
jgi:hypothetical protein